MKIRQRLLNKYNIEIGRVLRPLKDKIWCIGTLGYSLTSGNTMLLLCASENLLFDSNRNSCFKTFNTGINSSNGGYAYLKISKVGG